MHSSGLAAGTLRGAAAVVRDRGVVFDGKHLEADGGKSADRGFASGAGAFNLNVELTEALVIGGFARRFSGDLGREGCALLGAFVAKGASGAPRNDVSLGIGDGDDGVVERSVDVRDAFGEGAFDLLLAGGRGLGFCSSHFSLTSLAGSFLLVGDGLPLTFAGTGVGARALSAARESAFVADATIAANFGEALDVERDFAAEIAFGAVLGDFSTKSSELLIGEVFGADVDANAGIGADFVSSGVTDTVDIGKGDHDALLIRDINPSNTCHICLDFLSFAQPWRCLCLGLEQMTMTLPWRRMTLHLSQIGLTDGLTFIVFAPSVNAPVQFRYRKVMRPRVKS